MSNNKILFKKTQFLKETWSYIAPTWEEMGQICLDLDAWIVFPHERREVIDGLALKWKKNNLKIKEIRERLIKIGLPKKEVNIFLK